MAAVFSAQRSDPERDFERLYRRYVGDVYRYALVLLGNVADAEDVTQTAFLNAYRAFQGGELPERPLNWLIKITHNICRQRFRQAARRPSEVTLEGDVPDRLVDDEAPQAEEIRQALSQLAFNQRAALVMRELEGRSCAEIADVLGLSRSAVEGLLFRARRALREQLEGALTCNQAERSISRQLERRLERKERGALRAHLRACPECATVARRMRAQRSALRGLVALPLPSTLASFSAGGGATVVGVGGAALAGLALKAAALTAAAVVVAGAGYEAVHHRPWQSRSHRQAISAVAAHASARARLSPHDRGRRSRSERLSPPRSSPPQAGFSHGQARLEPRPNATTPAAKATHDAAAGRRRIASQSPRPPGGHDTHGHDTQVRGRAPTPMPSSPLSQEAVTRCGQEQLGDGAGWGASPTDFRHCLLAQERVATPVRAVPGGSRRG